MSTLLRIAFAWLLAVAIPLQGYAASRMLLCGPAHHPATVADRVSAPSHPADHPVSHAHAHEHVNAHEQTDIVLTAAIDDVRAAPASDAKTGYAGKCSVCASCCHSVALFAEVLAVPAMPHDRTLPSALPLVRERVWVGRLDRPPQLAAI
ncbi:hypothetical protein ACVBEH_03400 [Roseateles sp. GG27B]